MNKNSLLRRIATTTIVGFGAVLVTASAAAAHVTVNSDSEQAGSYAVLTFSVPHGCGEAATKEVAIQIPEGVTGVTPTLAPGWEVEKVTETLDEPFDDGHGGQITERVAEVVYSTGDPLPDGIRGAFELSVKLPDAAGETLFFPTLQTCVEDAEAAWVQMPADGEDSHDLELPAPSVELVGSEVEDAAVSTEAVNETQGSSSGPNSEDGTAGVISWVALVVAVIGAVLGGTALGRSRARN